MTIEILITAVGALGSLLTGSGAIYVIRRDAKGARTQKALSEPQMLAEADAQAIAWPLDAIEGATYL